MRESDARKGPRTHYGNMTRDKAGEIRHAYFRDREKQAVIAARFGITQASVSRIVSGHVWS